MTIDFARIQAKVQSYDWGKVGSSSKVAELASATGSFAADQSKPYAELWMGTHPNGPSVVVETATPLKSILDKDNLSEKLHESYNGDLPFLFKVLSIAKALSIQAHPDKKLAQELFKKLPNLYKDPNHKPEMAIALTPFEAFIGFRPLEEIKSHLEKYPEFAQVIGQDVANSFIDQVKKAGSLNDAENVESNKVALRKLFSALMNQDPDKIESTLSELLNRIKTSSNVLDALLVRLNQQFPGDVGIYCAFLLNYVTLNAGEAIFLAANEPHAYLSGDCVECMAASDNVVRSGLTPKFKDVETLVNMLTYNYGPADAQILRGEAFKGSKTTRLYDPPIEEFSILKTQLTKEQSSETIEKIQGPSIAVVTEGSGSIAVNGVEHEALTGYIFFIGAGVPVEMKLGTSSSFVVYRAFCQ